MTQQFQLPFEFGEHEAKVLSAALTYVDWYLTGLEADEDRKKKKERVVQKKREALDVLGISAADRGSLATSIAKSVSEWSEDKYTMFLVEACLAQPFAPYELHYKKADHLRALQALARLNLPNARADATVQRILDSIESARKAHKHIAWGKIAVFGVLGAVIVGLGGYMAAPAIAAQLGAAAGLSGAAAVAHGLALLGGGSLAAGGWGMAGGLWLVTGMGAAMGAAGAGGGTLLFNLGHAAALHELVKLQVTFDQVIIRSQLREAKGAAVIEALIEQQKALKEQLEREKELNEKNANRLEEIEKLIQAYEESVQWMKKKEQERQHG